MENEIPDGVCRLQALEAAAQTCVGGDSHSCVLERARAYYEFLTEKPKVEPKPNLSVLRGNRDPVN